MDGTVEGQAQGRDRPCDCPIGVVSRQSLCTIDGIALAEWFNRFNVAQATSALARWARVGRLPLVSSVRPNALHHQ